MDESFSRTGFLYGMAFVLAIGKACTLLIWRTLPKPRPPLRQDLAEAWHRRRTRTRIRAASPLHDPQHLTDGGRADGSQTQNTGSPIPPARAERADEITTPNASPKPL